jgi:hypothetical protein
MQVRRKTLVVLLLVVGCGQPAATARQLPALGTAPAIATTEVDATPAGAADFARSFYGQIEQAFDRKDPSLVAVLSAPRCSVCKRFTDSITELRDEHQRLTPVRFAIRFAVAPATDGRTARVEVQYDFSGSRRYDAAGRLLVEEKPAQRRTVTVSLVRLGGSWRVAAIS